MTLYGAAGLTGDLSAVTALYVREDLPPILLDDAAHAFACVRTEADLCLVPETVGEKWTLSLAVPEALKLAGYQTLTLRFTDSEKVLDTALEPVGRTWAKLRARGLVPENCMLTVTPDALCLEADGELYEWTEAGSLIRRPAP